MRRSFFIVSIIGLCTIGGALLISFSMVTKNAEYVRPFVAATNTIVQETEQKQADSAQEVVRREMEKENSTESVREKSSEISLLGWIPYWDQKSAFASFQENVDVFDYISVFWYRLDRNGNLKTYNAAMEDQKIIDFAHDNNVKVLAIIANLPDFTEGGDWDWRRVDRVIGKKKNRKAHIASLMRLVKERNFDGINIDYEALRKSQRDDFTLFIRELGDALHAEDKILGVALHPKTSENNPAEDNGSHAQDWKELYPYVDQMYLMTYGEHYLESNPGPIASVDWVDSILDYAVYGVGVPREKIFMGIPLYAEGWHETNAGEYGGVDADITFDNVQAIQEDYQAIVKWDGESQSPYFSYVEEQERHVVWFENSISLQAKLQLQEKYNIPNLAFWRLGGEDPAIWPILEDLKR